MDLKNLNGSTVLHEAAVNRNIEAVKLLFRKYGGGTLLTKNKYGETPLFTAAAFGSTEVVKYLASQPNQMTGDGKQLIEIHQIRDDGRGTSILYVAIRGQHFDTALELLRLDESLAGLKNRKGMTGLQLLAGMPSAFRSGCRMGAWKLLFYTCMPTSTDLPVGGGGDVEAADNHVDQVHSRDLESSQRHNCRCRFSLNLCKGRLGKVQKEKRKHKFAFELAKKLIEKDTTWLSIEDQASELVEGPEEQTIAEEHEDIWEDHDHTAVANRSTSSSAFAMGTSRQVPSPLLLAAAVGIMEIVKEMIRYCPQAVAHVNYKNQNILHVAAMYRQKEVFRVVDWMKVPMHSRLAQEFDIDGYTILHRIADMEHYTGGTRPGPAYQLQEELQWFNRVEKMMPSHYGLFKDVVHRKTPEELLNETHQKQLEEARDYIKMTAQACSTVAVLISTVVYAAAYTLPGGNNQHGRPMFENSSAFALFTVTDYIAVGCSLTSVVMFLSILVPPLQLRDFHHTLPRTLTMDSPSSSCRWRPP
ncbi:hypothetical protein ACOSQ2_013128 [Xanthoceras sorbifolium]